MLFWSSSILVIWVLVDVEGNLRDLINSLEVGVLSHEWLDMKFLLFYA